MELHQLRRFSILAEELHFTRAAERLHMEQSSCLASSSSSSRILAGFSR